MIRILALAAFATLSALPASAGNITNQQTCQLTAQHVVDILEAKDWTSEAAAEVEVLEAFIDAQGKIIEREVAASAAQLSMDVSAVQAMVDTQGTAIAANLDQRFGTEKLYRDYAVSLFNCAKLDPDALGSDAETFVATLERIGEWAQAGR